MNSSNLSFDVVLQHVRNWGATSESRPYNVNEVIRFLAAAIDNLSDNALQSELDGISLSESLLPNHVNFLYLLANRCGYSEFLRHCANDAINIFVRDVLIPQRLVDESKYDGNEEIMKLKSETSTKAAEIWRDVKLHQDT